MKKICKGCGELKDLSLFSKRAASEDGLQMKCKQCDRDRLKKWYYSNLDKNRAKRQEWQDNNRELHLEHVRAYNKRKRKKNKEDKEE